MDAPSTFRSSNLVLNRCTSSGFANSIPCYLLLLLLLLLLLPRNKHTKGGTRNMEDDLLFGLAKSAVKETINIARSAIEEENRLKKSVQRDLMLISDEFEMMQSFLNVEHASDEMSKTCVRQVRNMALDVEDCIENIMHLGSKSSWWHRVLPPCIPMHGPAAALDDAVDNIEQLKSRVEAMGQRNLRYSHIGNCGSKSVTQVHQLASGKINTTNFDFLAEVRKAALDNSDKTFDISDFMNGGYRLDNDRRLEVISVWGTGGGLGTTSMIRKEYNSGDYGWRAWVRVPHPFSPREFLQKLLIQLYANICGQDELNIGLEKIDVLKLMETKAMTEDGLVEEFMEKFSHQRYLVVLEDVVTMAEWDTIRAYLPDRNNSSTIVVCTQQFDVATLCIGTPNVFAQLKKELSADHSIYIFHYFETQKEGDTNKVRDEEDKRWLTDFKCVGRALDLSVLHDKVNRAQCEFVVVPVWGIAGVGKSSLVKKVFYEQKKGCYTHFGWADVSYPFNIMELSWRLLAYMRPNCPGRVNLEAITDPIKECGRLLRRWHSLVVIDGLQSTEEWDEIRTAWALDYEKTPCCIIVITNEESVGRYCATEAETVWNIKGLEFDDAHTLAKQKISHCQSPLCTDEQLTPILHKCGGIPKVIVAVAHALFYVSREEFPYRLCRLNDSFMHELQTNKQYSSLQHLFGWVQSYFRTCPDNLKPCIFYMSIFPVNHHIRRKRFVRRWIAEGYSRDTKERTAEETAAEDFSKLVRLNMIQVLQCTNAMFLLGIRTPTCQVNGFFHEYIKTQSMEENLVFALEGSCSINSQRTGRHLTIQSSWDRDRNVFESIDFSRLRSLTVFGKWEPFFMSDKIKLLRVLDLEDASNLTNADLEQVVKMLPRLRFLSVRGHKEITRLPDSLGSLQHLQTLDIRNTSISKLPKRINELEKLQYIRAGFKDREYNRSIDNRPLGRPATEVSCLFGFCRQRRDSLPRKCNVEVPVGVGKLTNLHTLGIIDVSVGRGQAFLKELKNLSQLHKLGVSGINSNNCKDLLSFVSGHGHLESLSVQLHEDNGGCLNVVTGFKPPKNLRSLKLYGLVDNLPSWIKQLRSLRKLNLKMTRLTHEEIEGLGHLPMLAVLCISLKEVQDGVLKFSNGFSSLLILEITCNPGLRRVLITTEEMKILEMLKMHSTEEVQNLGVPNMDSTKEMENLNVQNMDSTSFFQSSSLEKMENLDVLNTDSTLVSSSLEEMENLDVPDAHTKILDVATVHTSTSVSSSLEVSGLDHLPELKEIWLYGPFEDALKQRLKTEFTRRENGVKPILREGLPSSL